MCPDVPRTKSVLAFRNWVVAEAFEALVTICATGGARLGTVETKTKAIGYKPLVCLTTKAEVAYPLLKRIQRNISGIVHVQVQSLKVQFRVEDVP